MPVSTRKRLFWVCMILLVCLVALWVPLYNRVDPKLAGIPFFYWFQFGWIGISALVTTLAYKARI
jgi:hypothetical protein